MEIIHTKNVAVIIPAYNEGKTISDVLIDFCKAIPDASFYVINNASTDNTFEVAESTIKQLNCNGKVINHPIKGKANAVRTAFRTISADIYVLVDADQTYFADDLAKMIDMIINSNADIVIGDRLSNGGYMRENKRPFHNIGNRLVTFLINTLLNASLSDIMSGYRVMTRNFVKNFPILSAGFELETEMTLHALDKKFHILETPVKYHDRPIGSVSKLNTYRDGFKVIRTVFQIFSYYKPIIFYSSLSLIFVLFGLLVGTPVILEYIRYRYIYSVPKAILATGLMLFSLITASIGIILDAVSRNSKFSYEQGVLRSRSPD